MQITMFGGIRITVNGQNLLDTLGGSRKKIGLLLYLILNRGRSCTIRELTETLWQGNGNLNPDSSLKTMISRLRRDLLLFGLDDAVLTRSLAYAWNTKQDVYVDVYEFEDLCEKLEANSTLTEESRQCFERLLFLYKGDLKVWEASDAWMSQRSVHYHQLYQTVIRKYIKLLAANEEHQNVVRVCRLSQEIDPGNPAVNLELMSALVHLGYDKEALAQYGQTMGVTDVQANEELENLYTGLIHGETNTEVDVMRIHDELRSEETDMGAFVCDYSIFKDIYQIYTRLLVRLGVSIFVCLVTVSPTSRKEVNSLMLDKVMRQLLGTLKGNLRRGDTIARYSPSQYTILLPAVNFESGRVVMERVKQTFYEGMPPVGLALNYRLIPM